MTTASALMDTRATPVQRRFNVDDYYRMAEIGIIGRDDRVELLDGQVVEMSPIGKTHGMGVDAFTMMMTEAVRGQAIVRIQGVVRLDTFNEPEPDVAVLRLPLRKYGEAHPAPEDVFLIVEVGDSSRRFDKKVKLPMYAKFGIPEVWLVDLVKRHVEIHRSPDGNEYRDLTTLGPTDIASPEGFPEARIDLKEVF